ncbi:hypothetical protein LTR62_004730 [Meristemomyces frigidus]|uniref:Velvet domain-containing protein n=1 Tax=Meristemomyces frigidus TaxID=1508187 RepID=A0AAN7TLS4_9PEZI|nr:hypothetical protein LTR62_004730 [Meristemomyces frigidus]
MEGRELDNVTKSQTTRLKKDGKTLNYQLEVIQQPEHARACGAGAKSSADRRPVDPPPIVMLKIFDGSAPDTDITFSMNANYFLFATLEPARLMAHGRVPESKQQLTVLTGTPVAGMVYLDRPQAAGYFIFPDLSVRHEGKYRLSFSLYEELKDGKDDDTTDPAGSSSTHGEAHVTHRLEVKSEPFTVYSAKKFPGLTESTVLSRTVAEQGCRVRIRRDVRMRRRDTKASSKEWDDHEDATKEARARVSAEPDPSAYHPYADVTGRPRSGSNASLHSLPNPLSHRASQDMGPAFTQPFGSGPHTPQGYSSAPGYGPSPTQSLQAPFAPYQGMQPPLPQYGPQHAYHSPLPAPPQTHSPSLASYPNGYPAYPQHSHPPPPCDYGYRASFDSMAPSSAESRRTSSQYNIPPPPIYPTSRPYVASAQQTYHHAHNSSYGSQDGFLNRIPPPQPVQPPARASGATTPLSPRPPFDKLSGTAPLPPLPPLDMSKLEPSDPSDSHVPASLSATDSRKRQHPSAYQAGPLRQGARPDQLLPSANQDCEADEGEDGELDLRLVGLPGVRPMVYQRANGKPTTRYLSTGH